jgi:large subunit ribosomal protein L5
MAARLRERYEEEVGPALQKEFGYQNRMQLPTLNKIVINIGLGEAITNAKAVDAAVNDLKIIVGQKPVVTKAKKSIAQFKVRAGMEIGAMVTLRGVRMWAYHLGRSMVAETIRWVCASSWCFQRSTTIRSTGFAVWK